MKSMLMALCWGALLNLYAVTWNSVSSFPLGGASSGISTYGFGLAFDAQNQQTVAVWSDSTSHAPYYSLYNGTTWSTAGAALPLGASSGAIGIEAVYNASSQQTIVVWVNSLAPYNVYYTIYNGTSWSTPATIPLGASIGANYSLSLAFDPTSQNVIVSWADRSTRAPYYSVYNGTSWSTAAAIPLGGSSGVLGITPTLAPDVSSGQLVAFWGDIGNHAAYYSVYNGSSWTTAATVPLGGSSGVSGSTDALALDSNPNETIAAWVDNTSYQIYYSIYNGSSWSTAALPMSPSSGVSGNIALAFDNTAHQMLMLWSDLTNILIYYSFWDGTSWTAPQSFRNGFGAAGGVISLADDTVSQQMIAVWGMGLEGTNGFYTTTQVGPNPPSSATAQLLLDQYLTGTDRVHRLQWTASSDPTTVGYQISAGGTVEGTTTGTEIFLRNRVKGQLYNYSIAGYNSSGTVGQPLTVSAEG